MYQAVGSLIDLVPFFIVSVAFWAVFLVLVLILGRAKKAKALTVFFPFLAMLKTKKLNTLMRKIAMLNPQVWKVLFTVGIFVSFCLTAFGFYFFTMNLVTLVTRFDAPPPEAQVTPLIPGLTIGFNTFLYIIIPLLFVITTHELAHAISANSDGIPVKSTGIFGLGVFFIIAYGAFVEIDEKSYRKGRYSGWQKARLAAAGTFSNAILAVIALLLLSNFLFIMFPFYHEPNGEHVAHVYSSEEGGYNDFPGGLQAGDVIHGINGTLFLGNMTLTRYLVGISELGPNHTLECNVSRGGEFITVPAVTGPHPSNSSYPFMGIQTEPWWPPKNWFSALLGGTFPNLVSIELYWLFVIAFNVALFNMMPLPIFDGDKVIQAIVDHFIKEKQINKEFDEEYKVGKESPKKLQLAELKVTSVASVALVRPPADGKNYDGDPVEEILVEFEDYQLVDADGDGFIDHMTFEIKSEEIPPRSLIRVSYNAEIDEKRGLKRKIMNVIRIVTASIIVGNFVLSAVTMGFPLVFL